ncbi:SDR family NAD(P)-dependent oxidoreductase [Olivibacter sp. SDN3]|uniref:SDR family NAD(P)-dependent oxidoreductase n=1 Tax=Olivibacter sp. SDN3 TaxID=2764720 RepID=UPI001650E5E8|nr:SDR family NAD(P)-dependent oxidoreductase [Olivibacter sp. SDN3]QNL50962.1 SDR family NAD(P)-dependent oxidoreductase [Olivibacter sp. SDN3]
MIKGYKSTKTIAIVGAGGGIGFSTAKIFAKQGFNVALISRDMHKLSQQIEALELKENVILPLFGNVAKPSTLKPAFTHIIERFERLDILHYNVANIYSTNILEETPESLMEDYPVYAPALQASVLLAIESLRTTKGAILVTGGAIAYTPNPDYGALSIGKAAIANLTRSLSHELSNHGIYTGLLSIQSHVSPKFHLHHPDNIAQQLWNMYADRAVFEVVL